ncbi:MAG: hypothetical protein Q8O10_09995 [candidate division Zixibacteria bacterium]|nr:hypothetical protein [candidate division Zixibacteria bacterium]
MPQYDIYLPLTYNDGTAIESHKFELTRKELLEKFGGFSVLRASDLVEGWWQFGERIIRDDIRIFRVVTDKDDEPFWKEYKERLKTRFVQKDILIVNILATKV